MHGCDDSFRSSTDLDRAVALLRQIPLDPDDLPETLPEMGVGENTTLDLLAPHVLGGAAKLDASDAFAHMDPPTPWITWAMALWNARLNQNLLHQETAPFATEAEQRVIRWLTPFFGMGGGHMCSGSTISNLTALWAARDAGRVRRVVASKSAHLSIRKAALILGLPYEEVATNKHEQLDPKHLGDLTDACLVLTAGTTTTGTIDPLELAGRAAWTHIDAAWGGPLRLSPTYSHLLNGIEAADSVTISAHKWLFQPKDSALIFFRNPEYVTPAISLSSGYLTEPNIGIQGSRGAAAIPLLATLIAWGRRGMVERIDRAMMLANHFAEELADDERFELWGMPRTGVTLFRPTLGTTQDFYARLPSGILSTSTVQGARWLRSVAANPLADIEKILLAVRAVNSSHSS
ncbi:MAG: pyridoxal-dependent decarboxylase [Cyanobacteria bacterium P01_A01_bin.17]